MTLKPCDKWDDISSSIEACIVDNMFGSNLSLVHFWRYQKGTQHCTEWNIEKQHRTADWSTGSPNCGVDVVSLYGVLWAIGALDSFTQCTVYGGLNGNAHIDILGDFLVSSTHLLCYCEQYFILDNNGHVTEPNFWWKEKNNIHIMKWLPQSLDLNPFKNLWDQPSKSGYHKGFFQNPGCPNNITAGLWQCFPIWCTIHIDDTSTKSTEFNCPTGHLYSYIRLYNTSLEQPCTGFQSYTGQNEWMDECCLTTHWHNLGHSVSYQNEWDHLSVSANKVSESWVTLKCTKNIWYDIW